MKAHTQHTSEKKINSHQKKIYEKKGKVIDKRQPYSDREMQGCVGRIGHQGGKRLCERCRGEVIQQYLSKVT